jgi:phosphopentomutase
MSKPRAVVIVLDSLGIGASQDADKYGDTGADTLGHIAEHCNQGKADNAFRQGQLRIPNLQRWGLAEAAKESRKKALPIDNTTIVEGAYGFAQEVSVGKDTPSGHWEICGLPVPFEWGLFPNINPCFPKDLLHELIQHGKLKGTLANCHASGTQVIQEYGEAHIRSGKPICYTSADSVFQIAAHEEHFGLKRLYDLCDVARKLVDPLNIGRVIARPFLGNTSDGFQRTENRRDLTTPPHAPTLLDAVQASGSSVIAIGKISDIFAQQGISHSVKAPTNSKIVDALIEQMKKVDEGLLFANLVDFDSVFGHRRDVAGYAQAIEAFDSRLPEIESLMRPNDLVLITADHGCDPTWPGTDHTREYVPVLFNGPNVSQSNLGKRASFADMGATIAAHLNTCKLDHGTVCQL